MFSSLRVNHKEIYTILLIAMTNAGEEETGDSVLISDYGHQATGAF